MVQKADRRMRLKSEVPSPGCLRRLGAVRGSRKSKMTVQLSYAMDEIATDVKQGIERYVLQAGAQSSPGEEQG